MMLMAWLRGEEMRNAADRSSVGVEAAWLAGHKSPILDVTDIKQLQPWRRNEWNAQNLPPSVFRQYYSSEKKLLGDAAMLIGEQQNVWNSLETVCRHAISVNVTSCFFATLLMLSLSLLSTLQI